MPELIWITPRTALSVYHPQAPVHQRSLQSLWSGFHSNHKDAFDLSPPQRLKGYFFSDGVDPLSNVSAGTELQATAESAGASARYHTQDGRHPGETIFCALLPGVACTPCATVKMAGKILRFSDV